MDRDEPGIHRVPVRRRRALHAPCRSGRPTCSTRRDRLPGHDGRAFPTTTWTHGAGRIPAEMLAAQFEKVAAGWQRGWSTCTRRQRSPRGAAGRKRGGMAFCAGRTAAFSERGQPARFVISATPGRHAASPGRRRPPPANRQMRRLVRARWPWPGSCLRSPGEIPASASRHRTITFTCRWTWSRRSSTAGGFYSIRRRWVNNRLPDRSARPHR